MPRTGLVVIHEHHLAARTDRSQQRLDYGTLLGIGDLVEQEEAADAVVDAAARRRGVGNPGAGMREARELARHMCHLQGGNIDHVEPPAGADLGGDLARDVAVGAGRLQHPLPGRELDAGLPHQPRQVAPQDRCHHHRIVEQNQAGRRQIRPGVSVDEVVGQERLLRRRLLDKFRLYPAIHLIASVLGAGDTLICRFEQSAKRRTWVARHAIEPERRYLT